MTTPVVNRKVEQGGLDAALAHVRAGGSLMVPTYTRCTVITAKSLAAWESLGMWLIKEEAPGFRIRVGSRGRSVYLFPGQLVYA